MKSASIAVAVALVEVGLAGCTREPLPAIGLPIGDDSRSDANAGGFIVVPPCNADSDYVTGTTTISFGFLGARGAVYDPRCLAIEAGSTVTFSGDFDLHPLYPSRSRGALAGNPIGGRGSDSTRDVLFPQPGYFAYYCGIHGAFDDGSTMAGVVWAR